MTDKIKDAVSDYYTDKLKKFGNTPQGVDWNSEESQILRFKQLSKILPEAQTEFSLLDFGCGYGALYDFLTRSGQKPIYSGYDVSGEMIHACKEKFEGGNARWILSESDLSTHDFTIASGIFNVRMSFSNQEWLNYIVKTLQTINGLSEMGFAFNILTSYSDKEYMKDYLYYADPCFFFDYCKRNFSREVALLHDYHLYEFSILVRK